MRTLRSELVEKGLVDPDKVTVVKKNKVKESFSDRELRDLMGTNRQTYKRKNGAVRRR